MVLRLETGVGHAAAPGHCQRRQRFRDIAVEVLGAIEPALALKSDNRWAAGAFGVTSSWSAQLRSSIAETLAVIATQDDEDTELPGGGTGQQDRSGQLWSSLSDVLPTLAEASPERFLDAVDTGPDSGRLTAVFNAQVECSGFGIADSHGAAVVPLEHSPGPPLHLGSAALALARLAELDPGGRWANRPDRSLNQIFLPRYPRTTATLEVGPAR